MPWSVALALVACGSVFLRASGFAAEAGGRERPPLPPAEEIAGLPPDGGPDYNRLIFEKSPYLLQHAANPVDWYPWGEAAFERARAENKPVFLSIGYSTCHWCHVMEVESFEDPEVAALLNKDFIAIKVDREERPDLDHIYMSVTQALSGGGGWPMTVVMGPDKRPFFAGTYFPRTGRLGRPGMLELLPALADAWVNNRADIDDTTAQIDAFLARGRGAGADGAAPAEVGAAELETAYRQLAERYDPEHGGFGAAPKFPSPHTLLFLLRYAHRSGDAKALEMVERTLQAMRAGGLFDHVGLGFHRYSTDAEWLLPHFEKMLYDQAMLAMAYTEAWQATGKAEYAGTVREILDYVSRELTAPEGGFYSAQDADSEGEEGKFYLWTEEEARAALGAEDAELFLRVYGFGKDGNFKDEASGEKTGRNIPHRDRSDEAWAAELGMEPGRLAERLESARERLFEAREGRVHPFRDDKILTDWNGLMIASYAQAARALDEPKYAETAERAADFVLAKLRDGRGRLLKRYRGGEAGLPAHLDDYAFFVWGLIELYETTFDAARLETALELNDAMIEHYEDPDGGFFITADDGEELLVRPREYYDGAIPAGNSVAAMNLLRLARMTGRTEYEDRVDALLRAVGPEVAPVPSAHAHLMSAVDFAAGPSYEVVIAGEPGAEDTRAMLRALGERYLPTKVVLLRPEPEDAPAIARLAPFTASQRAVGGRATAYVCRNFACEAPTTDIAHMLAALNPKRTEMLREDPKK